MLAGVAYAVEAVALAAVVFLACGVAAYYLGEFLGYDD